MQVRGKASARRLTASLPMTWSNVTRSSQPCHCSPPQNGHPRRAPRLRRKSKIECSATCPRSWEAHPPRRLPAPAAASSPRVAPACGAGAHEPSARAAPSTMFVVWSSNPSVLNPFFRETAELGSAQVPATSVNRNAPPREPQSAPRRRRMSSQCAKVPGWCSGNGATSTRRSPPRAPASCANRSCRRRRTRRWASAGPLPRAEVQTA
jgi:hypothetical protein